MKIELTPEDVFEIQCALSRRIIQLNEQSLNHVSPGMRSICKVRALVLKDLHAKLERQLMAGRYESDDMPEKPPETGRI